MNEKPKMKTMEVKCSVTLKLFSYNSHESSLDRLVYIQEIFDDCDILLIQEYWLHKVNLDIYKSAIKDCGVYDTSGMNQNQLFVGRPFGGTALLWKSNSKFSVTPIELSVIQVV